MFRIQIELYTRLYTPMRLMAGSCEESELLLSSTPISGSRNVVGCLSQTVSSCSWGPVSGHSLGPVLRLCEISEIITQQIGLETDKSVLFRYA